MLRTALVVAAGGVIGALARYWLSIEFPSPSEGFRWTMAAINLSGCAAMGVLVVLVAYFWPGRPLLRPFIGTGILGGFTSFSAYALDVVALLQTRHAVIALAYLTATPLSCLVATWSAAAITSRLAVRPAHV